MSQQPSEEELLVEIRIPPLVVPEKWTASIDEDDLGKVTNDTRQMMLAMSKLQKAVNFAITALVDCRNFQIQIAATVNQNQRQIIALSRTSKAVKGYGGWIKGAGLIIGTLVIQELAKKWFFPGKP